MVCFYSDHKATYCHTRDKKNYLMDASLEHLEDQLDPKIFNRVNRKFIIHMNAITDIISYTNSRLQVKLQGFSELDVIVSRERVKDFKTWLE